MGDQHVVHGHVGCLILQQQGDARTQYIFDDVVANRQPVQGEVEAIGVPVRDAAPGVDIGSVCRGTTRYGWIVAVDGKSVDNDVSSPDGKQVAISGDIAWCCHGGFATAASRPWVNANLSAVDGQSFGNRYTFGIRTRADNKRIARRGRIDGCLNGAVDSPGVGIRNQTTPGRSLTHRPSRQRVAG